jgi:hypothetical protein
MSIYNSAQQTTLQGLGGLIIGGVIDQFFHPHDAVSSSNALLVGGEIVLQLGLAGLLTAGYFDFLTRRGFREDSIKGLAYYLTMLGSQPHLMSKIGALSKYIGSNFKNNFAGGSVPTGNAQNETGHAPINISTNAPGYPEGQNDMFAEM